MRGGEVDATLVHRYSRGVAGKGSVGPPPDRPERLRGRASAQPGFIDAVKELVEKVPSDRLQIVLNDCVAESMTQPGFIDAVEELAEKLPSDRLQIVLNDCEAEG